MLTLKLSQGGHCFRIYACFLLHGDMGSSSPGHSVNSQRFMQTAELTCAANTEAYIHIMFLLAHVHVRRWTEQRWRYYSHQGCLTAMTQQWTCLGTPGGISICFCGNQNGFFSWVVGPSPCMIVVTNKGILSSSNQDVFVR